MSSFPSITPPVCPIRNKSLTIHGDTRIDPYYWLNDRENPDVIQYLEAENKYTHTMLSHSQSLQDKLYKEIISRIKQDDASVPFLSNGYFYYTRFENGKEYPLYCRKKGALSAPEEIIIDVPKLSKDHKFYSVGAFAVSNDNQWVAWTVDTLSRRMYQVFIKNLSTGEMFDTGMQNGGGDVVWANDNKTIFFTTIDPNTLRYDRIFRFNLQKRDKPTEVYCEKDETFYYIGVEKTKDNRFLLITVHSTLSNETLYLDANQPDGKFQVFQHRTKDMLYSVAHYQHKFYVVTNWEAKNFRLMETDEAKTEKENWQTVIPHRPEVLIEDIKEFNDFLVVSERKNGLLQIRIINQKNKKEHYIGFDEEAYDVYLTTNPEMNTNTIRFNYTSLTTPVSVFDYNMENRTRELKKQEEVLGDFDPARYETHRLMVTARDGVKVPVSIVYKKGMVRNGSNPLLLYGYGSYGASTDPTFNSARLSLLDRGFVFAIAHIRGGQELGRQWYEDGKLLKKKNTFYDFIDCADFLIKEKYTHPDKLFAMGGSAGGLLMGAVANMRPELFKGMVVEVPFVDVVTTMLDPSIPLTTAEYDEWGNPNLKEYYDYMKSYSPYDNVEKKAYPAMLVTTGLHDSQVQYWEPAKWVAKLRALKTDRNPILLQTNMDAGHGGASGRFERYQKTAVIYTFLCDLAGVIGVKVKN